MRGFLVIVHRWAGLFIAVFLFIAGLTGTVISWDHELDEWLNPDLFEAKQAGQPLPPLELVSRFEARNPQARVDYFPLSYEAGKTADLFVVPRIDAATGRLYELDYNQAYVEPATGEVRGKRFWGRISLDRRDLLPFLYKLHYSMHIPDFYGFDQWGIWLMGIVGIVWMFDCFVGLWLTFPIVKRVAPGAYPRSLSGPEKSWFARWAPAWRIKRNASTYRLNFDIHRAFGLWAWLFLLLLAFTSISMNLGDEVVRPALGKVFSLTADVADSRTPAPLDKPIPPSLSFASILNIASDEAAKRSWQEPLGSTFYNQQTGIYSVSFFEAGEEHGNAGMEPKTLYFDGKTGVVLGDSVPWAGTAADIFMQLQFPLHSGRIAGLPGRIFLSVMGIVVAALSFTGIVIWFKKRLARTIRSERGDDRILDGKSRRSFAFATWIFGSFARRLLAFADEEDLRRRVMRLGQAAEDVGRRAEPLGVKSMVLLATTAVMLALSAVFIGAIGLLRRLSGLPEAARKMFGGFAVTLSSRGFWQGAKIDAAFYGRFLGRRFADARERSLSVLSFSSVR